ncbi:MAG: discoidin domain-containing protein, partial [Sedimentisphaerales bacterium]|nr:discoidin domain-containing protein [Sedimentisphaerales bacterium]
MDDNGDGFSVNEDSSNNPLDVLANDINVDADNGDTLTITTFSTPDSGGTVVNNDTNLTYTPAPDFLGEERFTYTIQDVVGESSTATVTVTVTNMNDAPVADDDAFTVIENTSNNILDVLANDSDPDPGDTENLTITEADNPGSQGGTVTINVDSKSLVYTPLPDFIGTETFQYTISDGNGGTDTALVTVTVGPVSFAPYFTSIPYEDALTDQMYRYRITAVDDNGDPVTIYGENLPEWLTLIDAIDGRAYLSGTPTVTEVGDHFIELVASDGLLEGIQTFTLCVHDNNIGPNDKTNWLATCSYEETVHADQGCMNAIDGDPATYWQSEWIYYNPDATLPHWIEIDLDNVYYINGIIYTPRQNKLTSHINEYELYVRLDEDGAWEPVASGQFLDASYASQEVTFSTETVRYIRLVSLSNFPGDPKEQTAIGELDIIISVVDVQQEPNEAPEGFIDIPFGVSNVNINVGETVSFAGHGFDPDGDFILYHWDFGNSGISVFTGPVPGAVQFDRPGAYVVTFTVYDGLMAYDPTPATLTVNVAGSSENISRNAWSVIYVDSEELDDVYRPAENSFDTSLSTYWQSEWQVAYPHEIQIDLGEEYLIDGFRYLPRPYNSNGRIKDFEFYVRGLDQPWGDPVITGTFAEGSAEQEIWFPAGVTGQQIRLVALSDFNGTPTACIADLNMFGAISGNQRPNGTIDSPVSPVAPINIGETLDFTGSGIDFEDGSTNLSYQWDFGNPNNWDFVNPASSTTDEDPGLVQFNAPGTYVVTLTVTDSEGAADLSPASVNFDVVSEDSILIDQTQMTVEYVESERADFGRGAVKVLDGDPITFWRTELIEADPNAILPNEIHIDLGNYYELDTIRYLPRQDNQYGRINEFELYVSWVYDGEWGDPVATGILLNTTAEQDITFPRTLCRYVRLVALTEVGGYDITSMAEFNAMGKLYTGPMPNQPPNGVIDLPEEDPKVITIGQSVEFSGTGTDPDGDPITYQWDFGDPDVNATYIVEATQADPGFIRFDNPGTYTVSFTVADAEDVDPSPATRQVHVKYNSIDLAKDDWTVSCISEETQYADQGCDNIIDGDPASYWNTEWGVVTNYPHWVIIGLGGMYNIDEIIYTPRPNKSAGRIKDYELYISHNDTDWNLVKFGTLLDTSDVQSILIPRTTGKFIKIVANTVHDVGGGYSSSIAEIDIRGDYIQSSMVIDPAAISVLSGDIVHFTASGGVGPYIFSLLDNKSDGEITAGGVYTAGTNVNGGVIDIVRVLDEGTWAVKDAVVTVAGPLAITPSFRFVAVNGMVDFDAIGGIPPYEFTFVDSASASGGTLNANTGEYQAGVTHSVTDYIRVTDWAGNFSDASVEVLDLALSISPTMPHIATGASQQFYATGGIPPYVFEEVYVPSGGGITPDGLYTAGGNIDVTDTIQVIDQGGVGTSVQTNIYVTELYTTLDQSLWTVHYVDSEELDNEVPKPAENAFDGDINTSWQSEWLLSSPPPPHEIQIDLGGTFLIDGFRYYPHQNNSKGRVEMYEFYVSTDGFNWGNPVSAGFFPYNADTEQKIIFPTQIARYVGFVGARAIHNQPVISVAELNILGQPYNGSYLPPDSIIDLPPDNLTINVGESIIFSGDVVEGDGPGPLTYHWNFGDAGIDDQYSASPGQLTFNTPGTFMITFTVSDGAGTADPTPDTRIIKVLGAPGAIIPQDKWELVAVDSEQIDNGVYMPAVHAFDGDSSTFWRTERIDFHPEAPGYPHEMIINLGSSYLLDTLRYLPREYITAGRIADYYVFVSEDGRDWGAAVANGTFENNNTEQYSVFSSKRGQFIRFVGMNEVNGEEMATVAELNLEGTCDVPYVKIIDPQADTFVHQKNLTVTASVCLNSTDHSGWGVRFIVDGVITKEVW